MAYETVWVQGIYRLQRSLDCDCGARHWRLLKLGANERADFPVLYDSGAVGFDRPESIARHIRERVQRTLQNEASP